jgi:hypothetical protein
VEAIPAIAGFFKSSITALVAKIVLITRSTRIRADIMPNK